MRPRVRWRVRDGFDVDGDPAGAGCRKRLHEVVGVRHHQVDVQRQLGEPAHRRAQARPERQVGHEVSVHDVEVQQVGPGGLDGAHLVRDPGEVAREQRGGDALGRNPSVRNLFLICPVLNSI